MNPLRQRNQSENLKKRNYSNKFVDNLRKGRKKVSSISANFEESDSEGEYINAPGPGSYYNESNTSTFKPRTEQPSPFQYFGSMSPRFSQSDAKKVPGPGAYKDQVAIPKKGPSEHSMFKKERRIETIFEKYISPGPGPGKYADNRTEFKSKKQYKNRKNKSNFISAERRFFYEPEYIKNPGPGKYFDQKDPMAIKGPSEKFDAQFGFKSERKVEKFLVAHENSPMYNLQDLDAIAQKKSTTRAPNNFTIMYKKEAPFMTSSPRFKVDEKATTDEVGPGKYEKKNSLLNKLISEALKQRIPKMPFNQSDDRFKGQHKEQPGPGAYSSDKDKWQKQTFNLRFIK